MTNGGLPPQATAKMAAVPHHTAVPVGNGTKQEAIEDMAGKWSDFSFKPIRESQVSRTFLLLFRPRVGMRYSNTTPQAP